MTTPTTPLRYRRKGLLAKLETTYGDDPTPAAADDSIETVELTVTPLEADYLDREHDRSQIGNRPQVLASQRVLMSFGTYLSRKTGGAAHPIDPLLRAAGFAQGVAVAADAMPDAWAADTAYALNEKVTHQNNVYIARRMHESAAGDVVNGAPGQAMSTAWLVSVADPAYTRYTLADEPADSVWLAANLDGVSHIASGARCNMAVALEAGALPRVNFEATGVYSTPTAAAAPAYNTARVEAPRAFVSRNVTQSRVGEIEVVMRSLDFNMNNEIVHLDNPGREIIFTNDRAPGGSLQIEMARPDEYDIYSLVTALNETSITTIIRLGAAERLALILEGVQLTNPRIAEADGRFMVDLDFRIASTDGSAVRLDLS